VLALNCLPTCSRRVALDRTLVARSQARLGRGERPSLADYVARRHEQADDIRSTSFPALILLFPIAPSL
jgi:hypothetical protein